MWHGFVLVALVGFSSGLMLEAWFVFLGVVGINFSLAWVGVLGC